jgi:hypothetical protein
MRLNLGYVRREHQHGIEHARRGRVPLRPAAWIVAPAALR